MNLDRSNNRSRVALEQTCAGQFKKSVRRLRVAGRRIGSWVIVLILLVWTLMPLLWTLLSTFKSPLEVYSGVLLPASLRLEAYIQVFHQPFFWRYFGNSVMLTVVSTTLVVVVSSLAAYSFARYAFPYRHILLLFVLIPRIIPRAALVVPLYRLWNQLGLLNTYTVLIICYTAAAVPLATWILVGFFKGVPISMEDSARLEGARFPTILLRIVIPMALPGLVSVVVVAGTMSWNEFPFVLSFIQDQEMRTLPYALYLLQDSLGIQNWPVVNSFTMITIMPILVVYLLFQKRVVNSMVSGAIK